MPPSTVMTRTMKSAIAGRQPVLVRSPDSDGATAAPSKKPPTSPDETRDLTDRSFSEPAEPRQHDDDRDDEIDPTHGRTG